MQGGWGRNWDQILQEYSSGEDGDEHDTPNILSLQRNVHRVTELMQDFVPGLSPETFKSRDPPMGMNRSDVIHDIPMQIISDVARQKSVPLPTPERSDDHASRTAKSPPLQNPKKAKQEEGKQEEQQEQQEQQEQKEEEDEEDGVLV